MLSPLTARELREIHRQIATVEGWLTAREIDFLATAAAHPTARGSIVELGSYKGKSTIILAKAARHAQDRHFVTVDPMFRGIRPALDRNLAEARVAEDVEVYEMLSDQFIASWNRPIRLLFHDGANQTEVVRRDVKSLRPCFSDGALIAFHDVLNTSGCRAEVFVEDILTSDHFGPVGFCGSIGWGQYFRDPSVGVKYEAQRARLRKKLARLLPLLGRAHGPVEKIRYKFLRSRIPHRCSSASRWLEAAA